MTKDLQLLVDLTKRDFKVRYLGSLLGSYWVIIHPAVMIFIYTVIFSQMMRNRLGTSAGPYSYSLYLCCGILPWNFFAEVLNRSLSTFPDNAHFIKKMSVRPLVLFGASFFSALTNFLIAFVIFLVALYMIQPPDFINLLGYLFTLALFGLFALGLGVAGGCLNVFLRDVQQLTGIILQLWFWFTPIVYLYEPLPDFAKKLLQFNPAFYFMDNFQKTLFQNSRLSWHDAAFSVVLTIAALLLGLFTYKRSISLIRDQL